MHAARSAHAAPWRVRTRVTRNAPLDVLWRLRLRLHAHDRLFAVEDERAVRAAARQRLQRFVGDEAVLAAVAAVVHKQLRFLGRRRVLARERRRAALRHGCERRRCR
jgi:hypothetical protein